MYINDVISCLLLRGQKIVNEVTVRKSWLEVLEMVVENVREHHDNG